MRKAKLNIIYNGTDISADITDRLISFSYNDNKQGEADDIEITAENRDGIWMRDWYPDKGAKLNVSLLLEDWTRAEGSPEGSNQAGNTSTSNNSADSNLSVNFGVFAIDEITASSGGVFTIKAIAAICEKAFKDELRYKTWENVTIRQVISKLALDNGLQLVWRADEGETYRCIYQTGQTDAAFIFDKANMAGLKIKISEEQIIIYEDSIGDSGVTLTPKDLSSYSFRSKTFGVYDSCQIDYLNPDINSVVSFRYVDPALPRTKLLVLNRQVETLEQAKKVAKAELNNRNSKEITASIELMGNPKIWSGQELTLKNFGVFDGVYILESVRHSIDRGGYKTSAELNIKRV